MSDSTTIDNGPCIQLGDYVILQRQKYTKLHKFGNLDSTCTLGKEQLELRNILLHPYGSVFKMCLKDAPSGQRSRGQRQRQNTLEICSDTELRSISEVLGISASGQDNRDISDSGDSQALKPEDIEQLRDECSDSTKLIEKIVENSKTFHSKTEYSQEKYLKKKEKKYFEFVQIRQPTIRLMHEIFYRQDAEKVMGIRVDTLSQIISYSGVSAYGNYLLYESGTNGLLPAAMLNAIGAGTTGKLVYMHPGNVAQKQALLALKLPLEQYERCISVNIYSVLREHYQGDKQNENGAETERQDSLEVAEPCLKKQKLANEEVADAEVVTEIKESTSNSNTNQHKWQLENKRACAVMTEKFDSLIIAAKEHPSNIIKTLLPFVKPSRPIVIFSLCKELLTELYVELKASFQVTNLHLTSNWLRTYQILPNRTHPEVNMNGNSGYLLTGYTINNFLCKNDLQIKQ